MRIAIDKISRRTMLAATAAGGLLTATTLAQAQTGVLTPQSDGRGGTNPGPSNPARINQNPDMMVPPTTDSGTLPNLRFSFDDAHMRLSAGGWTRQVTVRELGIADAMAGVNMRLNAGGVRELHWHKAAEWAYVLSGKARITAIDPNGHYFVNDVGVGDLWYFPPGIPHSIQGLDPDGTEFLLVFDDGDFNEDNTFLLSDFMKHTPPEVLAKNFGVPASSFASVPEPSQMYIFPAPVPGPLSADKISGAVEVPQSFSHRMMAQTPIKMKNGTARITDSKVFPVSKTIAAALVMLAAIFCLPAEAQTISVLVLDQAGAQTVLQAARGSAQQRKAPSAIAVVDPGGDLLAFQRMDGVRPASVDLAIQKARTAARLRRPTVEIEDSIDHGRTAFVTAQIMALQGGVPVRVNGEVVGAVGVAGLSKETDAEIARTAAAALASSSKMPAHD